MYKHDICSLEHPEWAWKKLKINYQVKQSLRQRKTMVSKSACLKAHPHRNMIHVLSAWYITHRLLWPAVCITTESHSSKTNVSDNTTSSTTVPDESHSSYSLADALTRLCCDISTAPVRKTVVSTVESVFFLKAISYYPLSAVNYSFHGEKLVFALRKINTTRLSIKLFY